MAQNYVAKSFFADGVVPENCVRGKYFTHGEVPDNKHPK